MKLSFKYLQGFIFFASVLGATAQVSVDGTVFISSNTIVSTDFDVNLSGRLINDGTFHLFSNLTNAGSYDGAGELRLRGVDQTLALNDTTATLTVSGGGIKTLSSLIWISNAMDLTDGVLATTTEVSLLGATILNASAASYIDGKLVRSGAGPLEFPVGNGSIYTPVVLDQIDGASPVMGLELIEQDPAGAPGYGLLSVSTQRYWSLSDETGAFDGAIVTLPVIGEDAAPAIDDLAIASGIATENFAGKGNGGVTGDLTDGTISSLQKITESDLTLGRFFNEQLRVNDSSALISIYEATYGTNWVDASNWGATDLDAWAGVTMENKRPVQVDLSSNNLSGAMGPITEGLDSLETLLLDNNALTDVPDLTGLTALSTLSLENNQLGFGPIESNWTIQNLTYVSQDSLFDFEEIIEEKGTTFTFDRMVSGTNNEYTWYKEELDGSVNQLGATTSTFDLDINEFAQEGYYYAEITNSLVSDLTIDTRPIFLKVSSLERDSLSLIAIYNKMNGGSWTQGSDWPETSLAQWDEIVISSDRVTAIDLPANNLIGAMPKDLLDIKGIKRVDISGNSVSGLPDLLQLPALTSIDVRNNNLQFDDLEPNVDVPGIQYDQQKEFGLALNEQLSVGSDFSLSEVAGGSQNQYQWYLMNAAGVTSALGTAMAQPVENIQYATMGDYYVEVTNPLVPGLTLKSKDKTLLATASVRFFAVDNSDTPINEGTGYLLEIIADQPYDSLPEVSGTSEGFDFGQVVLGNYIAAIEGPSEFLPTYFSDTDLWLEASVLEIRNNVEETIRLARKPGPTNGTSEILGIVESEFLENIEAGRIEARRKVKKAGCSLRRRTRSGGGRTGQEEDEFILVAYIQSNDQGQFEFQDIEAGYYRFNIEYPGVPMDESSFVEFEVGDNETFILEAYITEEGIEVIRTNELSAPKKEFFKNLNVYPVPADEQLTISYTRIISENVEMALMDLSGQTLIRKKVTNTFSNQLELNTSDLESGIYLLKFYDPTGNNRLMLTYKIAVSHR